MTGAVLGGALAGSTGTAAAEPITGSAVLNMLTGGTQGCAAKPDIPCGSSGSIDVAISAVLGLLLPGIFQSAGSSN